MARPRKLEQGLPKGIYLKSGTFYAVVRNKWIGLGKDLGVATSKAKELYDGVPAAGTMSHWLDQWILELGKQVAADELAPRTKSDYEKALVTLKAYLGAMQPLAVETKHITKFVEIGRDNGRAVTVNREKAALSSCMSWMVAHGHGGLKFNPCKGAPRNTEKKRGRYISDDEYSAVFTLASAPVRALMELMYRTLQRPSDILLWTHSTIITHDSVEMLSFRQGKTDAWVKIQVSASLRRAFDEMAAARKVKSLYLICRQDGKPYKFAGISGMYRRHVEASGVRDFGIYDIKAKGATDMYNAGVLLADICALCAHANEQTTEIYIKAHNPRVMKPNERIIASKTSSIIPAQAVEN